MSSPLTIVNPSDRDWTRHRYVLSFGAHADTHLMIWALGLDCALEVAAEWLAEHAPGHLTEPDYAAAVQERNCDCCRSEPGTCEGCASHAETDLTYTEAGWLISWEWCITLEDPSRAEIKAFIAALTERHYSDTPVVALG